ncbi:MAG: ABC transporter permease [Dehalococcoidia bacterium]
MTTVAENPSQDLTKKTFKRRLEDFARYIRRNPSLGVGIALVMSLLLFVIIGYATYEVERFRPLSGGPDLAPFESDPYNPGTRSGGYILGTDRQGRDVMSVMIAGIPLTLQIGLIAGLIGISVGTVLAFIAAYYGGWVDQVISTIVDVGLTIPGILILIVIAVNIQSGLSVQQMGLAVSAVAWVWPARTIRAQVLVMREQLYVEIARLSGTSGFSIMFKEMLPNLAPYIGASLVGSVASAILASVGLEALGLGPFDSPTLGMTIYWNIQFSSILHGMWWWFGPPILVLAMIFVGLFLITAGLDEWSNPRLRKRV